MKYKNLTPHDIRVFNSKFFLKKNKRPARIVMDTIRTIEEDGIIIAEVEPKIIDLPQEEKGVVYIVSSQCLRHIKDIGRTDVVAPYKVREGSDGKFGCLGFQRLKKEKK